MVVILRSSSELSDVPGYRFWAMIPAAFGHRRDVDLDPARRRQGLGAALEAAFDAEAQTWWTLARQQASVHSAALAHMPACAPNASDFGLMLAWSCLVARWAEENDATLVVCDDPWLYRHLRLMTGVIAGRAPVLWLRAVTLRMRGFLARARAAGKFLLAALNQRAAAAAPSAKRWILVYGHPSSTADGDDGYFGELMKLFPDIGRMLHVDCSSARAQSLRGDGRTVSLHGFGNPLWTLILPFARWRPARPAQACAQAWLIRRAAAHEGATGQGAAIAWQIHCQRRWLSRMRPSFVAWPWENHAWERDFVRAARQIGVRTLGYQHSVIGRQMLNYARESNVDGEQSLPDRIFCTGESTRQRLAKWNVPEWRLAIGGALRFQHRLRPLIRSDGPIFMALPFDIAVAHEMIEAGRELAARYHKKILAKDHPMTPFDFEESDGLQRTDHPFESQASISAVIFSATTVGLEAILAGAPTFRFRPRTRIALDILPDGVIVPTVDSDTMSDAITNTYAPQSIAAETIFAAADLNLWRDEFWRDED